MTSSAYSTQYDYPEFLENRSDDPRISPPKHPPLSTSDIVTRNLVQSTNQMQIPVKTFSNDVSTNQGLVDVDVTKSMTIDPYQSLLRNPNEKTSSRLNINDATINQAMRVPTFLLVNVDDTNEKSDRSKKESSNQIPTIEWESVNKQLNPQQIVIVTENKQPMRTYAGPFGLTRQASVIFYISMGIFTSLAVVFLILTGIFYSQNYPASSSSTAELVGLGVCALAFYCGLLMIFIGLWHQRYRKETLLKREDKASSKHNESSEHLKTSMENNEQYDYSYEQPVEYAPHEYKVNQPNHSNVNEKMLLEQPGAATGAGLYDTVVWPSNVEIETQPDPKFLQPMEWYSQLRQPVTSVHSPAAVDSSLPYSINQKIRKKSQSKPTKTVQSELPQVEFDTLFLSTNAVEQALPDLTTAPETYDLIKKNAQMELTAERSYTNEDILRKKENRVQRYDNRTDSASSNDRDEKHHHHLHHHKSSHRHHHHHRRHYSNNRHHHHHDHYRRRRSYSPEVHHVHHRDYMPAPHPHHYQHQHQHYHAHPMPVPRILTPNPPKIITPTPQKVNTTVFRDTGVNTGHETKIMRDSGVTADLEDIPNSPNNRLAQIPIIRRTIIVEPYPAQPSSQILVKPRADMIGKIRLEKNLTLDGENETIVYPSTAFMTKKTKKKKKTTTVNNNIIEDLHLEDIEDDENNQNDRKRTSTKTKTKKKKGTGTKSIKNAFYN